MHVDVDSSGTINAYLVSLPVPARQCLAIGFSVNRSCGMPRSTFKILQEQGLRISDGK